MTTFYRFLTWWDSRFRGNFVLSLLTPIFEALYCLCLAFLDFVKFCTGSKKKKKEAEEAEKEEDTETGCLDEPELETECSEDSGSQALLLF